jgi:hypothetical protein
MPELIGCCEWVSAIGVSTTHQVAQVEGKTKCRIVPPTWPRARQRAADVVAVVADRSRTDAFTSSNAAKCIADKCAADGGPHGRHVRCRPEQLAVSHRFAMARAQVVRKRHPITGELNALQA